MERRTTCTQESCSAWLATAVRAIDPCLWAPDGLSSISPLADFRHPAPSELRLDSASCDGTAFATHLCHVEKEDPVMRTASGIARYLAGVIFLVFGLNGFLHFIP